MTFGQITGVPILDYHRIAATGRPVLNGDRFAVHESAFRDQLQFLRDQGFSVVASEDVAAGKLPAKSAALTFDDGYLSHYDVAFRLLTEFGFLGTFFVNTSSIGSGEFLLWPMVEEMSRAGMRFGSHAHNHVVLTTLSVQRVTEELRVSRQILEQRLSCKVEALAVPYGFCSQRVLDSAWESGYSVVCTSRPWPAQQGRRVLSRVAVLQETTLKDFRRLVERDSAVYLGSWSRDRALAIPRYVFVRLRPSLLGVRTAEDSL